MGSEWMCVLHGVHCIIYIPGPHGNSSALYTDWELCLVREGERGGGKEEVVCLWLNMCAMSFKVKSHLPYGKMKFVCLHRLHRMELNGLQRCRMSVFVLQQMFCSCVCLALFLLTCHVSFWKKLKVHVCNVALRWKGEIGGERTARC